MINQLKNVQLSDWRPRRTKNRFQSLIDVAKEVRLQITELARVQENDLDLGGYCAVASWLLCQEANKIGLHPKLILGHFGEEQYEGEYCNHAWVAYYGKVIDITATQFTYYKYDEVHIVSTSNKMYLPIHTNKTSINTCLDLWLECQNPLHNESYLKDLPLALENLNRHRNRKNMDKAIRLKNVLDNRHVTITMEGVGLSL